METYKKVILGSSIVAVIIALSLLFYLLSPSRKPQPQPPSPQPETAAPVDVPGQKQEEIPAVESPELDMALNESDLPVRALLLECGGGNRWEGWLAREDLIRRFVAAVDNVANGISPAPHLRFLAPGGKFKVNKRGSQLLLDPRGYRRYDPAAATLASLDPAKAAALYRRVTPLFVKAYKELGYPDGDFHRAFTRAAETLLQVPVVDKPITLREKVTSYAFLDPKLENLNPAQKHLLRMGPKNIKIIQSQLKKILALLEP